MKTAIVLLILLTGCGKQVVTTTPPPINKDWTISMSFNFDWTNFNACTTAAPLGCINGFTWGYLNGTTQMPLHTTDTTICTGAQPQVCADTTQSKLPIGQVSFYVVANYVDNTGASGVSNALTTATPTTIAVNSLSNLQVSAK